jgi:hypothetical protein
MSKRINVNPGQYKVAGRERPGDDIPEPERSRGAKEGVRGAGEAVVRQKPKRDRKRR